MEILKKVGLVIKRVGVIILYIIAGIILLIVVSSQA